MTRETYEPTGLDGAGAVRRRSVTVSSMADGDPFDPKYFSVPADPELSLEEALSLAQKLFGERYTTVTETVTLVKSATAGSRK